MEYDKFIQGTYTSDGLAREIVLPFEPDHFEVKDQTKWGDTTAVTNIKSEWFLGFADASALGYTQTVTSNILVSSAVSSGGFTLLDSSVNPLGSPLTGSAVTAAEPAVVSLASTAGLVNGDVVLIAGTTGMLQIAGLPFSINAVVANTSISLEFSGVAATTATAPAASAAVVRRINFPNIYIPKLRYVTRITQASSAVITLSTVHGFAVGQQLRVNIPSEFGMTEMNGRSGFVTAINTTTNTVTVDINSSSFTAFAYPLSAVAGAGVSFPIVQPIGEIAESFDGSFTDTGFVGINIGLSVVGTSGSVMRWQASRAARIDNL